ncbi:MAG TPA: universal stress protein [Candidatus Acidoferrales bacterium]|nr:universal stress protein [Candidatus Acidoferrales bacterium]
MPRDFKKILCPTDFSEESYRAIEYGLRFAKAADGNLLIAHIVHVPTEHLHDEEGHLMSFDDLVQKTKERLEEVRTKCVEGYSKCEIIAEVGSPFELLMDLAAKRNIDLIVTSTHGRTGLQHFVMGSVAERIVRHAPCPVLVIRRGTE